MYNTASRSTKRESYEGIFRRGFTRIKGIKGLNGFLSEKAKEQPVVGNIRTLAGIVNGVFKRAIKLGVFKNTGEALPVRKTTGKGWDMGKDWKERQDSPLMQILPKPQFPLEELPGAADQVYNAWSRIAGALMQGGEEAPGIARFFLPRKIYRISEMRTPLREEIRRRQSLFTQGGEIPVEEFRNLREEKLTAISEMEETTLKV